VAGEAGQIFRPKSRSDGDIDGEIEFKNDQGQPSGRRVYLLLKSGDSHLRTRETKEEIFVIKNPDHIKYWQKQVVPVMLVIRTSDGNTRWMNVTEYLKRNEVRKTRQIVFNGEPFSALNLINLRSKLLYKEYP
jgi:hypothetical protein